MQHSRLHPSPAPTRLLQVLHRRLLLGHVLLDALHRQHRRLALPQRARHCLCGGGRAGQQQRGGALSRLGSKAGRAAAAGAVSTGAGAGEDRPSAPLSCWSAGSSQLQLARTASEARHPARPGAGRPQARLTGAMASSLCSGSRLSMTWLVAARDSRLSRTEDCGHGGGRGAGGQARPHGCSRLSRDSLKSSRQHQYAARAHALGSPPSTRSAQHSTPYCASTARAHHAHAPRVRRHGLGRRAPVGVLPAALHPRLVLVLGQLDEAQAQVAHHCRGGQAGSK